MEKAASPFEPGLLSRIPDRPKNAVIVCASRIGDFLCATPAFRALRRRLPDTQFSLIGLPFVSGLVSRNPYLDHYVPFPGFPGMAEQFFDACKARAFFERMQQQRFGLALQMHGSGAYSNIFTLMLGARFTCGFVREGGDPGRLDAALPWPASIHAARRALALAEFLGAASCGHELDFQLTPGDHAAAEELLRGCKGPFIGLHAGSREPSKLWPEEQFASAGKELQKLLGGTVVVLGGPDEGPAGERIATSLNGVARNLAGRKCLGEMGGVIARLAVLITNDSGPAHIAYALNRPSVTLFGSTDPEEWGPPARPVHRVLRSADRRLESISVDDAVKAALEAAGAENKYG
ncbi:MAG: hypothetical protein A2078_07220 [Nitrospirae bacterium GWC2_57_9]|nr:MAG: hypothetical protein A2078_07220 [Nitrospirae bacterium GWC2_57_9]